MLREVVFTDPNGDRQNARNIAIMVTDGQSNNPTETFMEAQKNHEANITILTIGKGSFLL